MTSFPHRPTNPEAEALFAFGDYPNRAPADDLEATLLRVQRTVGVAPSVIPPDLKHQIWEDLMSASAASTHPVPGQRLSGLGRAAELAPPVNANRGHDIRLGQWTTPVGRAVARWQPAISLALVVAFLAGLVGIAYQGGVLDDSGSGPGGSGSQPTIPFRGTVNQEDLKPGIDTADLPTAEDCTVDPLTVDEVIAILEDPDPSNGWYSESEVGPGYPPSQETIDAAAETLHIWNSCHLAGSDFQRWALETPASVQREVERRLPRLTSKKEARQILGEVWETGESANFAPAPATWWSDVIPVVDPNPAHSWFMPDTHLILGLVFYDAEGERIGSRPAQDTVQYARATGEYNNGSCYAITMGQSDDRTTWLIHEGVPGCG